jgi:hypothetical protein
MELQDVVGARMRDGEAFDTVEREVIEPSGLPEEQRSALWLFGWAVAHEDGRRFRRRALDDRARALG